MHSAPLPAAALPPVDDDDALPPGTRFGELEIVRVLGVGGFGIVYLARDHALERHVALKEYMPALLAHRGAGAAITVRSSAHAATYAVGLRSFVNEARLLARFDHPSLLRVYRFWEANGTAYMVMPYLQGRTLRDLRRSLSVPPSEGWIRQLLAAMLGVLELLHAEGVYHRDIAPDNILLPPSGAPMLLDFGAARRVIGDRTQTLTAILKPSYAPIEQYAEMAQLRQGPWTDLYALGAVAYYLLFGEPPPPATSRAVHDTLGTLPNALVDGISPRLLSTIAWMLAVRQQHRPQSVAELRAVLEGRAALPVPPVEAFVPPARTPAGPLAAPAVHPHTDFPPTRRVTRDLSPAVPDEPGPDDTVIRRMPLPPIPPAQPRAASARGPWRRRWVLAGAAGAAGVIGIAAAAVAAWRWASADAAPEARSSAEPPALRAEAPPHTRGTGL